MMAYVLWFIGTKVGRIILVSLLSLVGWVAFTQYYKHEGRKQVYEKIEQDTRKAKENRHDIETDTGSKPDGSFDNWLRDRGSN